MIIRIIGTESLGVRGLSCIVEFNNRKIFIDPGISLGYIRNGLKPHPLQIVVGSIIKERIIKELKDTTDIVISHFHGDHIPLSDANPYQLDMEDIKELSPNCKIWAYINKDSSGKIKSREESLVFSLEKDILQTERMVDNNISFSNPVPHGLKNSHLGNVIMTCIKHNNKTFLHASDIQFLESDTINKIIAFSPDIVLASGPPLYLEDYMEDKKEIAWKNLLKLANNIKTLILDHHLLRCYEGLEWINRLKLISGNNVMCAADYMNVEPLLLEAMRLQLYEDIPIRKNWHEEYENCGEDLGKYLVIGRKLYSWFPY